MPHSHYTYRSHQGKHYRSRKEWEKEQRKREDDRRGVENEAHRIREENDRVRRRADRERARRRKEEERDKAPRRKEERDKASKLKQQEAADLPVNHLGELIFGNIAMNKDISDKFSFNRGPRDRGELPHLASLLAQRKFEEAATLVRHATGHKDHRNTQTHFRSYDKRMERESMRRIVHDYGPWGNGTAVGIWAEKLDDGRDDDGRTILDHRAPSPYKPLDEKYRVHLPSRHRDHHHHREGSRGRRHLDDTGHHHRPASRHHDHLNRRHHTRPDERLHHRSRSV